MQYRRAIFDWVLCLSLVNLLFLRIWAQLLPAVMNRANLYYMQEAPHWIHYPAVLVALFAVGAAVAGLVHWARSSPWSAAKPLARTVMLGLFLAALNAVLGQAPEPLKDELRLALTLPGAVLLGVIAASLLLWLLWRRAAFVFSAIEIFAIFSSPFLLMTVGQAVWAFGNYDRGHFADGSLESGVLAEPLPPRPGDAPRVVWILFDELDQRAAFDARPAFLALPEFDRMQGESFASVNAFAPAGETRRSVASLLLGKQIAWGMPNGATALPCGIVAGDATIDVEDCWTAHRNLFDTLRERGINSAVAGWYHPYCRLFASSLTRCSWAGLPYWGSVRFRDSFDQQWEELIKAIPVARNWLRPGVRIRRDHANAYASILRAALEIASDPSIGFAFLHFPVPHHPDIYDPDRKKLSLDDPRSYFDNLALADRTLGEVRAAMESTGVWDESTVFVTSDHWWRAIHRGDWGLQPDEERVFAEGINRRIPFLAKFSGQRSPVSYAKPFNTILLHDLTLQIFAGGIGTAAEASAWLDVTRSQAPVPYLRREHVVRTNPSQALPPGAGRGYVPAGPN